MHFMRQENAQREFSISVSHAQAAKSERDSRVKTMQYCVNFWYNFIKRKNFACLQCYMLQVLQDFIVRLVSTK